MYGAKSIAGWAYDFGQGRVVFTSPGHTIHALWAPEYVKIQKRSVQWVLREISMNRRLFVKSVAAGAAGLAHLPLVQAALPKMKITRVRAYAPPSPNPLFNQADSVITIETDAGITGIGEGGFPDALKQCAGRLIGQDPQHIERLWQNMSRSFFYPPGREKEDALGALDLALWDIRGKVLKLPVHEILGGTTRNYCPSATTRAASCRASNRE